MLMFGLLLISGVLRASEAPRWVSADEFVRDIHRQQREQEARGVAHAQAASVAAGALREALAQNEQHLVVGSHAWLLLHMALHRAMLQEAIHGTGRKFIVVSFGGTASTALVAFLRSYGRAFHVHDPSPPPGGHLRELVSAASDCRQPHERAAGVAPWYCFLPRFSF